MTDKTPEAEATEHPPEEQETQPDVLETLRSDVEEMKTNLKEEVVNAFRDELQKLSQPQREKVPAPEIERDDNRATPGIRVTGHASDPLYRSLTGSEQAWRNRHSDGLAAQYLGALANSRHDLAERYAKELNDLCRAEEPGGARAGVPPRASRQFSRDPREHPRSLRSDRRAPSSAPSGGRGCPRHPKWKLPGPLQKMEPTSGLEPLTCSRW